MSCAYGYFVSLWAFDEKRWITPWGTTGLAVYSYVSLMGGGGSPADCVRTGERPTRPVRGGAISPSCCLPAVPATPRAGRCVARVPEALHVEVQPNYVQGVCRCLLVWAPLAGPALDLRKCFSGSLAGTGIARRSCGRVAVG